MSIIDLELTEISTDPVPYKPYSPSFKPRKPIVVRLEMEDDLVIEETSDHVTISTDGFAQLLCDLANLIEDTHNIRIDYQKRNHA